MSPADAEKGASFQGGITKITSARFNLGYHDGKSPEIITLKLTHVPKGDSEPRTEYLSCGAKAITNFKIGKGGKELIPKTGKASIHESTNAMIFLDSLVKAGFPSKKLAAGDMSVLDKLVINGRHKPMAREGLVIAGDGGDRPKTVLVVKSIVQLPWESKPRAADDDEDEDDDAKADDSSDDDADDEAETETDDEADTDSDDDAEADSDDDEDEPAADDDDESDDEVEVDDKAVAKHTVAVVEAAGGSLKKAKLGPAAFKALRKDPNRNAICVRMVEDDFLGGKLAKKAGIAYNSKTGVVTVG
jgi:hypothetical protein